MRSNNAESEVPCDGGDGMQPRPRLQVGGGGPWNGTRSNFWYPTTQYTVTHTRYPLFPHTYATYTVLVPLGRS